ncbi:hypothetical protein BGZ60DRAFT_547657 [Tricladium varicosporioides]|nr:hypothetical protein BGZ60DRAFT_547657 [Hymenoscyphus varicosporioides]
MISAWLQECLESHPTCNAASDILPTRTIDLSIPQRPFLYQPAQGMQAPYIALSHC